MRKGTARKRFPIAQQGTVKRLAKIVNHNNMTANLAEDGHIAFILTVIKNITTATIIFKIVLSINASQCASLIKNRKLR